MVFAAFLGLGDTARDVVELVFSAAVCFITARYLWSVRSHDARKKRVAVDGYEANVLMGMIADVRKAYRELVREHLKCEKRLAGQASQLAQMAEVLRDNRNRIAELEDKSDDPPRPRGSRLACAGLACALLFAPMMGGVSAAEKMRREGESRAVESLVQERTDSRLSGS